MDLDRFEKEWIDLAEEIVKRVFADEQIQKIKAELRTKGFLSWEQKNQFIIIADKVKADIIRERYGEEGSPAYQDFLTQWQDWQRELGRKRGKPANLFEENINHFLYGSTPDPEQFLKDFDINK